MCEVLLSNFEEIFPKIEEDFRNATFIALDAEFSGGINPSQEINKPSLFDNGRERYQKLRQCLGGYIVLQIGLTSFRFCRQGNAYVSTTYNFHVFPRSFFSLDNSFSCQASSLEFLSRHNFDFNKFVYEGLPYLSQSQESHLRQELCEGHLFQDLERTVTLDDERVLQEECSRVCEWVASAVLGDSLLLGRENLQRRGKSLVYMLHKELRKRFLSVWTFPEKGLVLVKKVSADERSDLVDLERKSSSLEHDVIKSMLGFSRVFKLLTELGKPLVGHNLLLDLALMYAQFHEPLPCIILNCEMQILKEHFMKQVGTLTVLSTAFTSVVVHFVLDVIVLSFPWQYRMSASAGIPLYHLTKEGPSRHLLWTLVAKQRKPSTCLDGPDPKSTRPRLLHIRAKGSKVIDLSEVTELFAQFGAVDAKLYNKQRALVAVGNYRIAREALHMFKDHKDLEVKLYSTLHHSPLARTLLWGGLTLSAVSCVTALVMFLRRISSH
uniref:Uncharacterized protein n=1 Tax=Timema tahoe TaxID=61484 RepID=A0A7R9IP53_9NEOP|nr:unnamed protein product [Timema tahoe]